MKLKIVAGADPKDLANNELTLTCRDHVGREHTVVLTDRAQQDLLIAIVGRSPALDQTIPRRSLAPIGIQLSHTSHTRLGLKLFLQYDIAIHFAIERPLADMLLRELSAFQWPDVTKQ